MTPTKAAVEMIEKNLKNLSEEDKATLGAFEDKVLPKLKKV